MDVLWFLKERIQFIRRFYETAAEPFEVIIRKIEAGEEPYALYYDESGEPPYLIEWQEADTGLQMVGHTCISMLSEALRLYFQTWESELRVQWQEGEKKRYFKKGFVRGYQRCFGEVLKIDWTESPADFDLLEQITLARNAAQHPEEISTVQGRHDMETRRRFPSAFFVDDTERHMISVENPLAEWFAPNVYVSRDKLTTAIEQVELLADWLEEFMLDVRFPRRHPPSH
jgi:hypothetical protein